MKLFVPTFPLAIYFFLGTIIAGSTGSVFAINTQILANAFYWFFGGGFSFGIAIHLCVFLLYRKSLSEKMNDLFITIWGSSLMMLFSQKLLQSRWESLPATDVRSTGLEVIGALVCVGVAFVLVRMGLWVNDGSINKNVLHLLAVVFVSISPALSMYGRPNAVYDLIFGVGLLGVQTVTFFLMNIAVGDMTQKSIQQKKETRQAWMIYIFLGCFAISLILANAFHLALPWMVALVIVILIIGLGLSWITGQFYKEEQNDNQ